MQLWLIPILPLAGFLINGIFGRRFSKSLVNTVAVGSVVLSFLWVLKTIFALGDLNGDGLLDAVTTENDYHNGSTALSIDRKSTRLNSSHRSLSRMPSSA